MFDAQLPMQTVYFIYLCLKLEPETYLFAEGLLSSIVLFHQDCLLVVEIGIVFPQFLYLSEDLSILLFIQLLIALDDLLPPNNFARQSCYFVASISLNLANNSHHRSL